MTEAGFRPAYQVQVVRTSAVSRERSRSAYLLDGDSAEPGQAASQAVGGVALEALAHERCVAQERSAVRRPPLGGTWLKRGTASLEAGLPVLAVNVSRTGTERTW